MARLLAFAAVLVACAPAQAQEPARTGPAFEVLRTAFVTIFDQPAYAFDVEITTVGLDSTTVQTGRATSQVSVETGMPWFVVTFDQGETRRASYDGETYQVDFPRTQTVYVDSTGQEVWSGAAWALMMNPAFGIGAHFFVQDAVTAKVVGADVVAGQPCTRAAFTMATDDGAAVGYSLCVDRKTAFPIETRLDDPDGTSVTARLIGVEVVPERPREAFRLDGEDGFERTPYEDETPPLAVGDPTPAFTATGPDGPVSLDDYPGRYVLLDFWGTWCGPCVGAIPELQAKAEAYPDLIVLGLAAHEYPDADPVGFVRQRGGAYPVARADDAVLDAFRVRAFPTYYLVGPDGAVVFASVADRDPDADARLDDLLATLFSD